MTKQKRIVIISASIIIGASATLSFLFLGKSASSCGVFNDSDMHCIEGVVTSTEFNCDYTRNLVDGEEVVNDTKYGVLCGVGSFMTVDGLSIQTATGFMLDGFGTDTTGVKVGDNVTVKYVLNEDGEAETSCSVCGIF